VSAESGNILIWNRLTEQVLFKEEQPGVKQITLLDGGQRFLAISRPADSGADVTRINATIVTRTIPGKPLQSLYPQTRLCTSSHGSTTPTSDVEKMPKYAISYS
jgi:hypothetical protein